MKIIKFGIPVLIVLLTLYLFIIEPAILTKIINERQQMPLGTVVAWVGIVAVAWIFYLLRPLKKDEFNQFVDRFLYLNLFAAFFWGLISFYLSGNWQFNFADPFNFQTWLFFSAFIIFMPVLLFVVLLIKRLFK